MNHYKLSRVRGRQEQDNIPHCYPEVTIKSVPGHCSSYCSGVICTVGAPLLIAFVGVCG